MVSEAKGDEEVSQDEYAVYEALFRMRLFDFDRSTVTVQDVTGPGCLREELTLQAMQGPVKYKVQKAAGLLENYILQNRSRRRIGKRLSAPAGWTSLAERQAIAPADGNFFVLSRVGFSPSSQEALVHIFYYGGPLAAIGYLVLMRRGETGWEDIDHCVTAVS